jgi:hypothetical protein
MTLKFSKENEIFQAAEISFFKDLPFLDDPDYSDEHSVEAMSGGEQQ